MNQPAAHIKVFTHTGCEIIQSSKVNFIEAHSNYSTLHLADKRIFTSKTLKYWFIRLDHHMVRCHRTYCVQKDSIVAFNREQSQLILSNGVQIPVSRKGRKKIITILQMTPKNKDDDSYREGKHHIHPSHYKQLNP